MYRNGILGCIVAIFFLVLIMASTGCSPAGLAGGAASVAVTTVADEVTDAGGNRNSGQGGKYSLDSYHTSEKAWGGHYQRIEGNTWYVAFVSKGAGGVEGEWENFIREEMDISDYEVLNKKIIETYPGFPAQKLKSIIRVGGSGEQVSYNLNAYDTPTEEVGGTTKLVTHKQIYKDYLVVHNSAASSRQKAKEQWSRYVEQETQEYEYEVLKSKVFSVDGDPVQYQVRGIVRLPRQ